MKKSDIEKAVAELMETGHHHEVGEHFCDFTLRLLESKKPVQTLLRDGEEWSIVDGSALHGFGQILSTSSRYPKAIGDQLIKMFLEK